MAAADRLMDMAPDKIIKQAIRGSSEWKLSYFCKHHISDELKEIIHEQFATKLFDKKGKETKMVDYTVSSNPHTNQLIVRCPTQQDAEAVLEVFEVVDVPPIQVKIDCLISEVYADMTFDRETTIVIENLFGGDFGLRPPTMNLSTVPATAGSMLKNIRFAFTSLRHCLSLP